MQKIQRGGSAKLTAALSVLAAIGIILGKFLAFNVTDFMRFSLENITIIFAGVVFGPLLGAAVGTVQDLVGCIAVGYAINPIITLGSAVIGAASGAVFRLFGKIKPALRIALAVLISHLLGSVIIKSAGLAIFYSLPFGITVAWRILNYVIVGTVEAVLLYFLLKSKQLLSQINKITVFSLSQKFKSLSEASAYAKGVSGVFSKPGLERIEALLTPLGSPEKSVRIVHVTGTNGKGSTSAMLTSILIKAGLKVGSFNSPYLIEMRESIRIGGEPISESELVALLDRLRTVADRLEDKPTEFELLTAAAYLKFKEEGVDLAVIECGMGARRDATNVIDSPLVSVITGVSIDHTAYLGPTLSDIAREKAGVIKAGTPLVIGDIEGEALALITAEAKRLSAPIYTPCEYTVRALSLDGATVDCGGIKDIRLPLLGVHQPKNTAIAVRVAELLRDSFPCITDESVRAGISDTVWHGRFEILSRDPMFIFDGAHNLEGIKSAVESIKSYFGDKVVCLTGVLADKEYEKMAQMIAAVSDTVITLTPPNPRALSAEDYAAVLRSHLSYAEAEETVSGAVRRAVEIANERSLPVVCLGSLYVYADVKAAVEELTGK